MPFVILCFVHKVCVHRVLVLDDQPTVCSCVCVCACVHLYLRYSLIVITSKALMDVLAFWFRPYIF